MAVSTDDGHSRLGQTCFGTHHMDNSVFGGTDFENRDTVFGTVIFEHRQLPGGLQILYRQMLILCGYTETGANKLKGMLPAKTVVGHKTGSSDRNADGMKTADNDAGLVILPDGRKYYIAAFVMDSYETDEDNANIIARISRMVYDAMR